MSFSCLQSAFPMFRKNRTISKTGDERATGRRCLREGYPTVRAVGEAIAEVEQQYEVVRTQSFSETVSYQAATMRLPSQRRSATITSYNLLSSCCFYANVLCAGTIAAPSAYCCNHKCEKAGCCKGKAATYPSGACAAHLALGLA